MNEITKQDRVYENGKKLRYFYGRGSSIRCKHPFESETFRLLSSHGEFWAVMNKNNRTESIHREQIGEIFVDGKWIAFDGNPKVWRKLS
jgi:hypothetical protein